jgi:peptidyl-tRNA hydrolase, PTH1 family
MKLFVGLGNPGTKYARNRHNIGFMSVDAIAAEHGFSPWKKKFQGEAATGELNGEPCLLLKPATYMNDSGKAVGEAARYHRIEIGDIIVFHDELDLAPGKVRVKTGGGNAGHNGLRSISALVGNDCVRVRLGIGHPGVKELVHPYVLGDFLREDREWLEPLLERLAKAAPFLASGDGPRFMTEVARDTAAEAKDAKLAVKPDKPKKAAAPPTSEAKPPAENALADTLRRWMTGKSSSQD